METVSLLTASYNFDTIYDLRQRTNGIFPPPILLLGVQVEDKALRILGRRCILCPFDVTELHSCSESKWDLKSNLLVTRMTAIWLQMLFYFTTNSIKKIHIMKLIPSRQRKNHIMLPQHYQSRLF